VRGFSDRTSGGRRNCCDIRLGDGGHDLLHFGLRRLGGGRGLLSLLLLLGHDYALSCELSAC